MTNQYLAFYVSSHGFGHMTRCLAIIEELLETTDHLIYVASGAYQNSFARTYLARFGDRVVYKDIRTEVGLVNKENTLQVDIPRLEQELTDFMAGWDTAVAEEVAYLQHLPVACVVSDISVIGIQVGEQLGVRNIGIANFTWCEQYEFLGLSETIIARFREVYAKLDLLIEYDLMLPTQSWMSQENRSASCAAASIPTASQPSKNNTAQASSSPAANPPIWTTSRSTTTTAPSLPPAASI